MAELFKLRYLPLFYQDLSQVHDYISHILQNPMAAKQLIESTEQAILNRLHNPLASSPYHSFKNRNFPYYSIPVKNYIVFYVVIDQVMEVRRFLYCKRNFSALL
ncbi:translation repressor RelE [Clostridia bacterium]|nr:translation repressor RelE [Clostridia bacterium]